MIDKLKKYRKLLFYVTFIFIVIGANLLFFKRFMLSNELIVRQGDPIDAFIPFLIYIRNKIMSGDFSLWSWEAGMGMNTISTFSGAVFVNLLVLPALFLSDKGIFIYFKWLPLIAGVIFALLLFKFIIYLIENDEQETKGSFSNMIIAGTGSLIVSLAPIIIDNGIIYPTFYASYCLLPLLLWGLEKVLREKKYGLFIFAVFLQAITFFYFLFVFSIFIVLYYIVEKAVISQNFREFFCDSIKCAGAYLLGVGMASVILIPQLLGVLASPRVAINGFFTWFTIYKSYSSIKILQDYFFGSLGLSIIPFAFIPIAFLTKSIKCVIKYSIYLLIIIIPIISPVLSWLMSAFDYPQQRWYPVLGIILAVFFTRAFYKIVHFQSAEEFSSTQKKKSRFVYLVCLPGIIWLGVSGFVFVHPTFSQIFKSFEYQIKFGLIVLFGLILLVLAYLLQKCTRLTFVLLFSSLILINTTVVTNITISQKMEKTRFLKPDYFNGEGIFDGTQEVAAKISDSDKSFYRTQKMYMSESRNDSLTDGIKSYNIYNSLINGNYVGFLFDTQNIPNDGLYWNVANSLDRRIFLETLFGNKYYISKEDEVPQYGYTKKMEFNGFHVFENRYSLPIGIFFDKYITKKEYMKLPAALKDVTLNYAVVLDKKTRTMDNYDTSHITYDVFPVTAEKVKSKAFDIIPQNPNSFSIRSKKEVDITTEGALIIQPLAEGKGFYFLDYTLKRKNRNKRMNVSIFVPQSGYKNLTTERAQNQKAFYPNQKHTFNLGYYTEGLDKIEITMSKQNYSIYNMNLYRIDSKIYDEAIPQLLDNAMKDVVVKGKLVSGVINAPRNGYLFFAIPFDRGWKAYVDGKRVNTEKIDIAFTGIKITKGKHTIELRYTPPGFIIGAVISMLSITAFIFCIIYKKKLTYWSI